MNLIKKLSILVKSFGVSGYEWVDGGIAQTIQTVMGEKGIRIYDNLVYKLGNGKKKLFISAHMDEVGFILTKKKKDYCSVMPIGSISIENTVNQKLVFLPNEIQSIKTNKSKSFANLKVYFKKQPNIGDIGTFFKKITFAGNIFNSPCLDNRVGCFALIQTYQLLKSKNIKDKTIFFCFAPREEQGANGVISAVKQIKPELCIDVDSAYAQPIKKLWERKNWYVPVLGKGPAIQLLGTDYILTYNNRKTIENIIKQNRLLFQYEIPDRDMGGTFAQTLIANGYETIQINVPVAFQHYSRSKVSLKDIKNSIKLLKKLLISIL